MPHVEMPNARGLVSKSLNSGCTDEQEARLHAPADDVGGHPPAQAATHGGRRHPPRKTGVADGAPTMLALGPPALLFAERDRSARGVCQVRSGCHPRPLKPLEASKSGACPVAPKEGILEKSAGGIRRGRADRARSRALRSVQSRQGGVLPARLHSRPFARDESRRRRRRRYLRSYRTMRAPDTHAYK